MNASRFRSWLQLLLALFLLGPLLPGCLPEPEPSPTPPHAHDSSYSAPGDDYIRPGAASPLVDALSYDLDAHLMPAFHRLEVTATVCLRWMPDTTMASFYRAPRLKVDVARVNDKPVAITGSGGWVTVPLPAESDSATITVHYAGEITGPPPGGNWTGGGLDHIAEGNVALGFIGWYPSLGAFGQDFYTALLTVWVPQGWIAIATGSPAGQEETPTEMGTTDLIASLER